MVAAHGVVFSMVLEVQAELGTAGAAAAAVIPSITYLCIPVSKMGGFAAVIAVDVRQHDVTVRIGC